MIDKEQEERENPEKERGEMEGEKVEFLMPLRRAFLGENWAVISAVDRG